MKKQFGFTAIEGLLILVIVGILGGTGWYVYNAHNNTQNSYANADNSNTSTVSAKKKAPAKDPTVEWIALSNKDGIFSLKYPKTWVTAKDPSACSKGIVLLGIDANSVGVCGSENFGQVAIVSVLGDSQKTSELSTGYKNITTTAVTLNGVTGKKQTATASGQGADGAPGALADGTTVTKYIFFTNNWTYTATYTSANLSGKAYPDALADFNTMVTKTLKFTA